MERFGRARRQVVSVDADSFVAMTEPIDPLLRAERRRVSESALIDVELLYRDHRPRLVGLAAAITMDYGVAEEIVQDAFVGLQRHAGRIDNPVGYLQRSVVNLSVTLIRRRRVIASHPPTPFSPPSSPEVDETWSAVMRLPVRQRAVVLLRFWDDMTVDGIAAMLDWPAGSVKSTLHRAMKRLKEELK
jgi:RNA polymerase sigma factor (sigma-70 family)